MYKYKGIVILLFWIDLLYCSDDKYVSVADRVKYYSEIGIITSSQFSLRKSKSVATLDSSLELSSTETNKINETNEINNPSQMSLKENTTDSNTEPSNIPLETASETVLKKIPSQTIDTVLEKDISSDTSLGVSGTSTKPLERETVLEREAVLEKEGRKENEQTLNELLKKKLDSIDITANDTSTNTPLEDDTKSLNESDISSLISYSSSMLSSTLEIDKITSLEITGANPNTNSILNDTPSVSNLFSDNSSLQDNNVCLDTEPTYSHMAKDTQDTKVNSNQVTDSPEENKEGINNDEEIFDDTIYCDVSEDNYPIYANSEMEMIQKGPKCNEHKENMIFSRSHSINPLSSQEDDSAINASGLSSDHTLASEDNILDYEKNKLSRIREHINRLNGSTKAFTHFTNHMKKYKHLTANNCMVLYYAWLSHVKQIEIPLYISLLVTESILEHISKSLKHKNTSLTLIIIPQIYTTLNQIVENDLTIDAFMKICVGIVLNTAYNDIKKKITDNWQPIIKTHGYICGVYLALNIFINALSEYSPVNRKAIATLQALAREIFKEINSLHITLNDLKEKERKIRHIISIYENNVFSLALKAANYPIIYVEELDSNSDCVSLFLEDKSQVIFWTMYLYSFGGNDVIDKNIQLSLYLFNSSIQENKNQSTDENTKINVGYVIDIIALTKGITEVIIHNNLQLYHNHLQEYNTICNIDRKVPSRQSCSNCFPSTLRSVVIGDSTCLSEICYVISYVCNRPLETLTISILNNNEIDKLLNALNIMSIAVTKLGFLISSENKDKALTLLRCINHYPNHWVIGDIPIIQSDYVIDSFEYRIPEDTPPKKLTIQYIPNTKMCTPLFMAHDYLESVSKDIPNDPKEFSSYSNGINELKNQISSEFIKMHEKYSTPTNQTSKNRSTKVRSMIEKRNTDTTSKCIYKLHKYITRRAHKTQIFKVIKKYLCLEEIYIEAILNVNTIRTLLNSLVDQTSIEFITSDNFVFSLCFHYSTPIKQEYSKMLWKEIETQQIILANQYTLQPRSQEHKDNNTPSDKYYDLVRI
ncbi:hypothetical protein NEOKW01_0335 [Nematocida sp. AWRm80]|nr:hypothetical protein NEOKW01_0335 [Nematocida sp. AWRm80]